MSKFNITVPVGKRSFSAESESKSRKTIIVLITWSKSRSELLQSRRCDLESGIFLVTGIINYAAVRWTSDHAAVVPMSKSTATGPYEKEQA